MLNRKGDTWALLVHGKDVTAETQFLASAGPADAYYDFRLTTSNLTAPLPERFRLQLGLDGVIRCQAEPRCPGELEVWSRAEGARP